MMLAMRGGGMLGRKIRRSGFGGRVANLSSSLMPRDSGRPSQGLHHREDRNN